MSGKKARRARKSGGGEDPNNKWTMNDVRTMIHNPVYAGIGPYTPLVDEATWVRAQEREIHDDGAAAVLLQVRQALLETFGYLPAWMAAPGWLESAKAECDRQGAERYLTSLLGHLRDAYADASTPEVPSTDE